MSGDNKDEFYNFDEGFEGMTPQEKAEFLFAKMMSDGRIDELVFRATFVKRVVTQIHEMLGGDGLLELLVALDRVGNWETEIIAERADVDNYLLTQYGAFDDDMWEKVKETNAWKQMHFDIFELSKTRLTQCVDEVMNQH
jgi:hypothetical protein